VNAMLASRYDLAPWRYAREADEAARAAQCELQAALVAGGCVELGEHCYVSPLAGLDPERFRLGPHCLVAAWAVLEGELTAGSHCSFNAHAVVRGRVTFGNFVRIASHACVIGFEHVTDDVERPIATQGIRRRGIAIGDDVWIGAGAQVLDGVRIGAHAVVGAGAVVTRDVPAYAVVVGNPAQVLRDRRRPRPAPPRALLGAAAARIGEELPPLVARHRIDDLHYADVAGGASSLRALCDAIELAALSGTAPAPRDTLIAALHARQDPTTGLPLDAAQMPAAAAPPLGDFQTAYQLLAVGYALECLGARYLRPIASVAALSPAALVAWLDALPLREQPWNAGALIDALASALWFNRAHVQAGDESAYVALFEWLARQLFPHTGLWAGGQRQHGWLQPVNGWYRIVRGTYAQYGVQVPQPAATIDTVLAHCRFYEDFAARGVTACNVLDALYALWICGRASAHRRDDARAFAARQVALIVARWQPGGGFAFAPGQPPGLHGTEMWLAALATAAALLELEECWPLAPRGIHRLQERPA